MFLVYVCYRCLYLSVSLDHCVFVFFFFKQKTAYEMRISDWSSDVCSSDLWISPLLECCPSSSLKLLPRNHQSDHARIICAGLDLQICAKRCLAGCTFASFDKRQPQSAMCLCKCRVETDRAAIELHRVHQIALIEIGRAHV